MFVYIVEVCLCIKEVYVYMVEACLIMVEMCLCVWGPNLANLCFLCNKLFGFQICWLCTYLMKVIPETRFVH